MQLGRGVAKALAGNWDLLALALPVPKASITKGGKINKNTQSPSPREGVSHQVVTFTCCKVLAARAPRPASTTHPFGPLAWPRGALRGWSRPQVPLAGRKQPEPRLPTCSAPLPVPQRPSSSALFPLRSVPVRQCGKRQLFWTRCLLAKHA